MKKIIFLLFLFLLPLNFVQAEEAAKKIDIYIFTQQGCQYCAKVKTYLDELKKTDYPGLVVHEFDIRTNPEYVQDYIKYAIAYNVYSPNMGVPISYVGEKAVEGAVLTDLRGIIEICNIKECKNPETVIKEYFEQHPEANSKIPNSTNATIWGWAILGVIIIGSGLLIYKLAKK